MRRQREARGVALREVARLTGITAGELSRFERGHQIPSDQQAVALAPFYGPLIDLYPRRVLDALAPDQTCRACGRPLAPDATAARRYHPDCPRRRK